MTTEIQEALITYLGAKRRFYDSLKSYRQCKRNCRFGGRWPKMTRDAKRRYFEAAETLHTDMTRYYYLKRQLKAA